MTKAGDPCDQCGSGKTEIWGESGVFWLHCHECDRDGPDIDEEFEKRIDARAKAKPHPQPWCDECRKPKCECDYRRDNR